MKKRILSLALALALVLALVPAAIATDSPVIPGPGLDGSDKFDLGPPDLDYDNDDNQKGWRASGWMDIKSNLALYNLLNAVTLVLEVPVKPDGDIGFVFNYVDPSDNWPWIQTDIDVDDLWQNDPGLPGGKLIFTLSDMDGYDDFVNCVNGGILVTYWGGIWEDSIWRDCVWEDLGVTAAYLIGDFRDFDPDRDFTDLPPDHRAYDDIMYLVEKEIVVGKDGRAFGPDDTLSRAEFAVIANRINGADSNDIDGFIYDEDDVPYDLAWWYWGIQHVMYALQHGYMTTDDDGNFMPDEAMNRQDVYFTAAMLFNEYDLEEDAEAFILARGYTDNGLGSSLMIRSEVCVLFAMILRCELGHNWSEWEISVPATTQAPGTEARTCSRCNATDTRTIDQLPLPSPDPSPSPSPSPSPTPTPSPSPEPDTEKDDTTISVTAPEGDDTASIPNNTLNEIRQGRLKLEVTFADEDGEALGTVSFSEKAAAQMISDAKGGGVNVSMKAVDTDGLDLSGLSEEQAGAVADRPVYEFNVTDFNNNPITQFGGDVTVTLPYALAGDEDPNAIVVYYLSDKGVEVMRGYYDEAKKAVILTTNHFSRYVIGYNPVTFADTGLAGAGMRGHITFVASRGLFIGHNGNFNPNGNITYAELTAVLSNYNGNVFTDFPADHLSWGAAFGLFGDRTFDPGAAVTRADMAYLIYNYINAADVTVSAIRSFSFSDLGVVEEDLTKAILSLAAAGIISGDTGDGGVFRPGDTITRAEVAAIIAQFVKAFGQ